jgi:thiol:disulfide interchange protein DsbD
MKKIYTTTVLFFATAFSIMAQSSKQVQWAYSAKKVADKTYEIHMTATVGNGFHLYAQNAGVDGPQPTHFEFVKNSLVTIDGKVKENGKLIKKFESAWSATVNYYEHTVDFVQVVKLKGNVKTSLSGSVEFMVCDDSKCLPPSIVEFKVNIGG